MNLQLMKFHARKVGKRMKNIQKMKFVLLDMKRWSE